MLPGSGNMKLNMKGKKAQGMSMDTIIVAAIALIVLIVIVMIFTGKIGKAREETEKASAGFGADVCKVPGTTRECASSDAECSQRGGSVFTPPTSGWKDCRVCCSK